MKEGHNRVTVLMGIGEMDAPSLTRGPSDQSIVPASANPHCGPLNENLSITNFH
jgi:hypothetical protein